MDARYRVKRAPQDAPPTPTAIGGTTTVGRPTGTDFQVNSTASPISIASLVQSNASTSTGPPASSASAADVNAPISVEQPIPVRTLVAICVAAFILVAGLVIFVLWFGARSRRAKAASQNSTQINGLDYLKSNNADGGTTTGTAEELNLKGFPVNNNVAPPVAAGLTSDQSSYYSQSTGRKPSQVPYNPHGRRPTTADSVDQQQQQAVYTIPANYSSTYADEQSFLPKQNVYTRNDMAPVSPRSASAAMPTYPQQGYNNEPVAQSSPRSQSAQAIVRPYVVGAHPYASQIRGGSSHGRPSIEHSGNFTVATALPVSDGELGLSGYNYQQQQQQQQHTPSTSLSYGGSPSAANGTFAAAGVRPGYDAYGIEPKQTPQHTHTRSQSTGRQPIQNLSARPSLESIRSIARKASIDRTAVEAATDFINGGPQAVGSRSRNNSVSSSTKGRVTSGGSAYGGGGGGGSAAGYTASVYSARSGKEGKSGGTKEKLSKSEKKREMEAMDNLIAALDESALREKRRKEALAEAAGVGNGPSGGSGSGSAAAAPTNGNESDSANASRRRKDVAITGSYPLPPAEVFRAALAPPTRGQEHEMVDDDVDDEEIERWRRR